MVFHQSESQQNYTCASNLCFPFNCLISRRYRFRPFTEPFEDEIRVTLGDLSTAPHIFCGQMTSVVPHHPAGVTCEQPYLTGQIEVKRWNSDFVWFSVSSIRLFAPQGKTIISVVAEAAVVVVTIVVVVVVNGVVIVVTAAAAVAVVVVVVVVVM